MSPTDYRRLIDRGRRAGLGTPELYRALEARPPGPGDRRPGRADGNGFVPAYAPGGRRVYRPANGLPPPAG